MKTKVLTGILLVSFIYTFSYAADKKYTIDDVQNLVPKQARDGWWHKQVSTMPENRYMSSFKSLDHKGKLGWNDQDLSRGKISIINVMERAQKWATDNKPFGIQNWLVDNVSYRFRSGEKEIEYICSVTLRTPEFKTIEVIILPNNEVLPPEINPEF